jgi:hypothetical protein
MYFDIMAFVTEKSKRNGIPDQFKQINDRLAGINDDVESKIGSAINKRSSN